MYDDIVMDHIKNARNFRVLEDADRQVEGTNPMCGDHLTVYLQISHGQIADVAFQCTCCGISMASASMMTEAVKGASVEEARRTAQDLLALIDTAGTSDAPSEQQLERLALWETAKRFPARARCARLPWVTLADALK